MLVRLLQFRKYMLLLLYSVGACRNLMGTFKDAIVDIRMFIGVLKTAVPISGTCVWLWKLWMRLLAGLAVL